MLSNIDPLLIISKYDSQVSVESPLPKFVLNLSINKLQYEQLNL
jgi:hypothetical protein